MKNISLAIIFLSALFFLAYPFLCWLKMMPIANYLALIGFAFLIIVAVIETINFLRS